MRFALLALCTFYSSIAVLSCSTASVLPVGAAADGGADGGAGTPQDAGAETRVVDAAVDATVTDAGPSPTDTGVDAPAKGDAGGSPDADGGDASASVGPPSSFGTYITLGDSISAGGGTPPFFYALLMHNDDTLYPAWQGHDLSTRYPNITSVQSAVAGSTTGPYNNEPPGPAMLTTQVHALGNSYPGNVFVTITIGGNDIWKNASALAGGQGLAVLTQFSANLKAALDELTTPGRLGSGTVYIVEANVYDATDGQGDWMTACNPQFFPNITPPQDQMIFSFVNGAVANAIAQHSTFDAPLDLFGVFAGHGANFPATDWYIADCMHPTAAGHHEIRREAWRILTGESLP